MAAAMATTCPQVSAKGAAMILAEKNENAENVPRMRTSPVTTVAMEAGLAMTNQVQA